MPRFEVLTHISVNADSAEHATAIVSGILDEQNASAAEAEMSYQTDGVIEQED